MSNCANQFKKTFYGGMSLTESSEKSFNIIIVIGGEDTELSLEKIFVTQTNKEVQIHFEVAMGEL